MLLATWALWKREVVRFLRERGRLSGALGTPLLFWALLGSGFGRSFRGGTGSEESYLAFFFPGTLALMVVFTAIFSAISVITDRDAGFMQGVLASPAPRAAIVVSRLAGGMALAVFQAALLLPLAPVVGLSLAPSGVGIALVSLALLAFWVTGLGFFLAWRFDSTQGFHAIVNLLLMPLWLLSGAVFPLTTAAAWQRVPMLVNPMTHGVSAVRAGLTGASDGPALVTSITVTAATAALSLAACVWSISRPNPRARTAG
jgi:ABC-2 type transport system permease protein